MLKSKIFQIAIIFCIVLGTSLAIFADTIRLKDGSVIKGRIISFHDGQFTVQIGDGSRSRQMTFFSDEIDAIEFDSANALAKNSSTSAVLPARPNASPSPVPISNPIQNNSKTGSGDVIVVGKKDSDVPQTATPASTPTPTVISPPVNQTTAISNPPPSSRPKPIQLNLKVLADNTSNGWTNAGWVVRKGQKIKITGAGRISLGNGNYSTPSGIASLADKDKLMQKEPTGELIAVIGDDNNDFIPIGASKEFIATRDGALFLGINEGNLNDNSGAFEITVEIDPTAN
ncbi:MAG: LecA/PA-IL family lectin [Pyrinomonadaceae bacterium]